MGPLKANENEGSELYKVWAKALLNIEKNWDHMNWFEKIEYIFLSPFFFIL
jgi:hypothetical protein